MKNNKSEMLNVRLSLEDKAKLDALIMTLPTPAVLDGAKKNKGTHSWHLNTNHAPLLSP